MTRWAFSAATLGLLLLGAATTAHAQTLTLPPSSRLVSDAQPLQVAQQVGGGDSSQPSLVPQPHRTLELDSKGRWGVRLDMEQPNGRSATWQDVSAGAYVSLGSRVRIGGSVGLGDKFDNPQRITPQDAAQPRVRLETRFKF
jgi:hypothetical protein